MTNEERWVKFLPYLNRKHRDTEIHRISGDLYRRSGRPLLDQYQRRQVLCFAFDSWNQPEVLSICADWMEDQFPGNGWSGYLRDRPNRIKAVHLLALSVAKARSWLQGLRARMTDVGRLLARHRHEKWGIHPLNAGTTLGIVDPLEYPGLPVFPGSNELFDPPVTVAVSYITSNFHCERLAWACLGEEEVFDDVKCFTCEVIRACDYAMGELREIPWTGFPHVPIPTPNSVLEYHSE